MEHYLDLFMNYLAVERGLARCTLVAYGRDLCRYLTRLQRQGVTQLATIRELLVAGMALEAVLPAFTVNPARLLRLAGRGEIAIGADADLVALDATGGADTVIIRGQVHVRGGAAVRRGTFEN